MTWAEVWAEVWPPLAAAGAGLALVWGVLVGTLWLRRPDTASLREGLRLLPDVVRLVRRMATGTALPRGVRARLWLLLAYLASPVDLVPDVVPVLGWADDLVVVALTLRAVVRRAGPAALERHWPGTSDGLSLVRALAGLGRATGTAP
ncbi:DUF1232 domain-containing protein [Nocardioides perillae]|uniref:Uncharacterized membrane protein YkvA (DUF1232 family) n=1 Tax=Nocardioides perillae TaxID=1119534 RepID=A0A7Y9RWE7_9ACTN|nr:uncharacterized membrane protein YkvA (DUF1232 family) [Nocardioides perillae]